MSKKVLVVLTSHDRLGDTGKETGFYLPEVSHPVAEFDRAGLTVIERGATHTKSPNFQTHVEVSDRLITGQNPASAQVVGVEMVRLILA
jgi:putative intracellular protease/amidase